MVGCVCEVSRLESAVRICRSWKPVLWIPPDFRMDASIFHILEKF